MPPSPFPGRVIAVVEDDAAVLSSLQYALEVQGYRVRLFDRAQAALDSDEILSADCLVIDCALPDFDGLSLLSRLRRRGLRRPAILMTSNPTDRCRREAEKAGAPLVEMSVMGDRLEGLLHGIFGEPRGIC